MVTENEKQQDKGGKNIDTLLGTPDNPGPLGKKIMDVLGVVGGGTSTLDKILCGGILGGNLNDIIHMMEVDMLKADMKAALMTLVAVVNAAGGEVTATKEQITEALEIEKAKAMTMTTGADGSRIWKVDREKLDEYRASQKEAGGSKGPESGSGRSPQATDETAEG